MTLRSGSVSSQIATPVLDAIEQFQGFYSPTNAPASVFAGFRSPDIQPFGSTSIPMFGTTLGVVGSIGYSATAGRNIQTWPSAAGATAQSGQGVALWHFPFYQKFSLPGSIPISFIPAIWKYQVDFLVRIALAGGTEVDVAVGYDTPAVVAGNNPFAAWSHRPAVNGGRWTPRFRIVTAGVITDGPDSGLLSGNWHKLGLAYTMGSIPRLSWLGDDKVVFELIGDAAQLGPLGSGAFKVFPSKNVGAGVGTTVEFQESRFRVTEISTSA